MPVQRVRGGAGLYWETELLWRRLRERAAIGPVGNGRLQVPHTSFTNIFPGIININTGQPVPIGAIARPGLPTLPRGCERSRLR